MRNVFEAILECGHDEDLPRRCLRTLAVLTHPPVPARSWISLHNGFYRVRLCGILKIAPITAASPAPFGPDPKPNRYRYTAYCKARCGAMPTLTVGMGIL